MTPRAALRSLIRQHWVLAAILVGFVALGTHYSVVTPRFESPDEIWHYAYAAHLASGGGLPVMEPDTGQPFRQEGAQAPLYYILAASLTSWIDQSDWQARTWDNPLPHIGAPASPVGKNLFIHTKAEGFPWPGSILALHLIRFLSVVLGAGSILLIYGIVSALFPGRRSLALGATAVSAFSPQFLFIHGSVNNDTLLVFTSSLVLFLTVWLVRTPPSTAYLVGLGAGLGLALLSKLSALGLIAVVLGGLLFRFRAWETPRRFARGTLIVAATTLAVAGWWYARNQNLYGEPTGWSQFEANIGFRSGPLTLESLQEELWGLEVSYWGMFGWFNVPLDEGVYSALGIIDRLALGGLLVLAVRRYRRGTGSLGLSTPVALGLLLTWLAILAVSWLSFMLVALAGQGRYFFPASAAISVLLILGLGAWLPSQWRRWVAPGLSTGLFVLSAAAPLLYIRPAYAWPTRVATSPSRLTSEVHATFGDHIQLVGATVPDQSADIGDQVELTLTWRALAPVPEDYVEAVKVFRPDGIVVGQIDSYPGRGTYPTSLWIPGEYILDEVKIPITGPLEVASSGRIDVSLYEWPARQGLPSYDPAGNRVGQLVVGRVRLAPSRPPSLEIANPVRFRLGDEIALIGYDLEPPTPLPLSPLLLTLYWQALSPTDQDYTVFVHVVDESGELRAQHDNPPAAGTYPTSLWILGEVIRDPYRLTLPSDLPTGDYRIRVGMYDPSTGVRLSAWDDDERLADDAVPLAFLTIGA